MPLEIVRALRFPSRWSVRKWWSPLVAEASVAMPPRGNSGLSTVILDNYRKVSFIPKQKSRFTDKKRIWRRYKQRSHPKFREPRRYNATNKPSRNRDCELR